jgi:hypothetical protein
METDTALLKRKGEILFKFWSMKHQNDKRIGDLTIGDFVDMCEALARIKKKYRKKLSK